MMYIPGDLFKWTYEPENLAKVFGGPPVEAPLVNPPIDPAAWIVQPDVVEVDDSVLETAKEREAADTRRDRFWTNQRFFYRRVDY